MSKRIVYTCITGDYDELRLPTRYNMDWTHLCFTDNQEMLMRERIGPYKILPVHNDIETDDVRLARRHKILGLGVNEADIFIWHDANMYINCNLNEFANKLGDADLALAIHPERNDLFDEIKRCVELKKDDKVTLNKQLEIYKGIEKRPTGLWATGVLIRRKITCNLNFFYYKWWHHVQLLSRRDQISLAYCLNIEKGIKINTFSFQEMLENFPKQKHNPNEFGGKY